MITKLIRARDLDLQLNFPSLKFLFFSPIADVLQRETLEEEEGRLKKNKTYLSPQELWSQDSLGLKLAETGETPQNERDVSAQTFRLKPG